ncbi:hypothetical protein BRC19_02740 [Candidatus Saccharibacteria bacterium QS_5_54_17]|nr:MAG: hypothetical protein BRC19_02740 [Candidatus Saccharibacteria bacterium QS_5_54_17]
MHSEQRGEGGAADNYSDMASTAEYAPDSAVFFERIADQSWMSGEVTEKSTARLKSELDQQARPALDEWSWLWTHHLLQLTDYMRQAARQEPNIENLGVSDPDTHPEMHQEISETSHMPEGMNVDHELLQQIFAVVSGHVMGEAAHSPRTTEPEQVRDRWSEVMGVNGDNQAPNQAHASSDQLDMYAHLETTFDSMQVMLNARNLIIDRISDMKAQLDMQPVQQARRDELFDKAERLARHITTSSEGESPANDVDETFVAIARDTIRLIHDNSVARQHRLRQTNPA